MQQAQRKTARALREAHQRAEDIKTIRLGPQCQPRNDNFIIRNLSGTPNSLSSHDLCSNVGSFVQTGNVLRQRIGDCGCHSDGESSESSFSGGESVLTSRNLSLPSPTETTESEGSEDTEIEEELISLREERQVFVQYSPMLTNSRVSIDAKKLASDIDVYTVIHVVRIGSSPSLCVQDNAQTALYNLEEGRQKSPSLLRV